MLEGGAALYARDVLQVSEGIQSRSDALDAIVVEIQLL